MLLPSRNPQIINLCTVDITISVKLQQQNFSAYMSNKRKLLCSTNNLAIYLFQCMRSPLERFWLLSVAISKLSTICAGPEMIRVSCLPPLMELSGKFLRSNKKNMTQAIQEALYVLLLLVTESLQQLFLVAPVGGVTTPLTMLSAQTPSQPFCLQWHTMFRLQSLPGLIAGLNTF